MIKILLTIFALIIASCSIWGSSGPVVIGGITPLSGPNTSYGIMMKNITEMIKDEINANGGINGRELQIIWRDGKCSAQEAANAALELIQKEKVDLILGGVCSQETIAAGKIANDEEVLLISPISTSPEISYLGDYIFRTMVPSSSQGRALGKFVNNKKYQNIALIQDQNDYVKPIQDNFDLNFMGKYVSEKIVSSEQTEFGYELDEVVASNPDAIFINLQSPKAFVLLMEQISEREINIPIITNQVGLGGLPQVKNKAYLNKNKVVGADFYVDFSRPELALIEKKYEELYGIPLEYHSFAGSTLDAMSVLREVLSRAINPSKSKYLARLLYEVQIPGATGAIIFNEFGDIRGRNSLLCYDGEKFEVLEKESY